VTFAITESHARNGVSRTSVTAMFSVKAVIDEDKVKIMDFSYACEVDPAGVSEDFWTHL
jgi:hypothetical protein